MIFPAKLFNKKINGYMSKTNIEIKIYEIAYF